MPKDSDCWIGNVTFVNWQNLYKTSWQLIRSTMCWHLQGAPIGYLQWWNLLVQDNHRRWGLVLQLWLWDNRLILPMKSTTSTRPKKVKNIKSKVKSISSFSLTSGELCRKNSSKQSVPPSTITFNGNSMKCAKISLQTLVTKELAVASQQHSISYFMLTTDILMKNIMILIHHLPYSLTRPSATFFCSPWLLIWKSSWKPTIWHG